MNALDLGVFSPPAFLGGALDGVGGFDREAVRIQHSRFPLLVCQMAVILWLEPGPAPYRPDSTPVNFPALVRIKIRTRRRKEAGRSGASRGPRKVHAPYRDLHGTRPAGKVGFPSSRFRRRTVVDPVLRTLSGEEGSQILALGTVTTLIRAG